VAPKQEPVLRSAIVWGHLEKLSTEDKMRNPLFVKMVFGKGLVGFHRRKPQHRMCEDHPAKRDPKGAELDAEREQSGIR
jgi:hypothetical protein